MNSKISYSVVLSFILVLSSCTQKNINTDDSFDGLMLPDGSIVLLNHNSTLTYDKRFNTREVNLKGEAYFKVVAAQKPFTVITAMGKIIVKGTRFDVNSTEDELEVEVESGKVELIVEHETKEITKGMRAVYSNESNRIKIEKATYKFKIWLKELEIELKKLGIVIKNESHKVGKGLEKKGKELNKKLKKIK